MNRQSRKGSALLVVLGFLSFMVVSAVAFAIWMRTERLPSSALRRSVANRYLVKAALAQAMSRLDDAIRSHPYPGAWYTNNIQQSTQDPVYRDKNGFAYDFWEARVFMPPDPEGWMKNDEADSQANPRYAPVTKTVSVLNLEALGYLPPALINDVRLLSRSSWAAKWDYFNFDAGRYAFCAVNVSDMLDINKISADSPRTSAAAAHFNLSGGERLKPPPSRFSLAYLFRKDGNTASFSDLSGLDDFDKYIHTERTYWGNAPLASLMDYNLAMGDRRCGDIRIQSPFYFRIKPDGEKNETFFYGASSGSMVKRHERQPFITDTWFPSSRLVPSDGTPNTPLDLSQHQPFRREALQTGQSSYAAAAAAMEDDFWTTMLDHGGAFSFMDIFSLFDYLDEDDVPVSLAFPCVERVPMLAALAPSGNVKVDFTETSEPDQDVGTHVKKTSVINIKLDVTGLGLGSVLVFPFKNGPSPIKCEVQAFGRLAFVLQSTNPDDGNAAGGSVSLRHTRFARDLRPLSDAEWEAVVDNDHQFMLEAGSGPGVLARTAEKDCLLVTLPATGHEEWEPREPTSSDWLSLKGNCWEEKFLRFRDVMLEKPIIKQIKYYKKSQEDGTVDAEPERTTYQMLLRPFKPDGSVVEEIDPEKELEVDDSAFAALCAQYTMKPYLVAWARVKQDGKTVDMVPATYDDDKAFNTVDNNQVMFPQKGIMMDRVNPMLGNFRVTAPDGKDPNEKLQLPILRFAGSMQLSYTHAYTKAKPDENEWTDKACYAVDPRYNWAPENWWFETVERQDYGDHWYKAVFKEGGTGSQGILNDLVSYEFNSQVQGRGDRANDPFLFVSNLGYLQSVGELAFLPRLTYMLEKNRTTIFSYLLGHKRENKENDSINSDEYLYNGVARGSNMDVNNPMPCALAAWRSYQNYRTNPDGFEFGANLYRRGLVNGSQGFYVNPYTQSQEVMLAALANTPLNYWVAGTNIVEEQERDKIPSKFNESPYNGFMFNESSSKGMQMTGEDVNKIALFLRHRFEDLTSMITPPNAVNSDMIYAYAKVWEDLFDALDWGGCLGDNYTVNRLYQDLREYLDGGGTGAAYNEMYTDKNGYDGLNELVKGNRQGVRAQFTLDLDRVIHQDELDCSADPLRGETKDPAFSDGTKGQFFNRLSSIDRQFLHSYWRDCFANRQQLFLIFVRAESTALGGAGEGTPAQQGGRAVALVWRDPEAPTGGSIRESDNVESDQAQIERRHPHRMRVLFYRQFD